MSASNGRIKRIEYIKSIDDKYINIKIPHSLQNQVIIEKFLNDLEEVRFHQLVGDWFLFNFYTKIKLLPMNKC